MEKNPLPRLDTNPALIKALEKYCRLSPGQIWKDPLGKHSVGCLDAANEQHISTLMHGEKAALAIHDPPYNLVAFDVRSISDFTVWCKKWVSNTNDHLSNDSSLYIWLGADQRNAFQPLPDFMIMMRDFSNLKSKSFITMRNQRGYGTQKNWMAVRQECLFYTKGSPAFNIEAEYTDIPKILKGYYKEVKGELTENTERGKGDTIRASNVWVDIQQIFYRMHENVNGCFAQKPIKSCDRIITASSQKNELVVDFFAHSGSTLLSAEALQRRCFTIDIEPIFCEISIRRLENYRATGEFGWQNSNPFAKEIAQDQSLQDLISKINEK